VHPQLRVDAESAAQVRLKAAASAAVATPRCKRLNSRHRSAHRTRTRGLTRRLPTLHLQVDALLAPDVFDRPAALLSVQLAGAPAGSSVADARFGVPVAARALSGGAAAVVAALAPLLGAALPEACAAPCDAACLSAALGGEALPEGLPLDDPSVAALVSELGCFLSSARAAAASPELAQHVSARLGAYAAVVRAHGVGSDAERAAAQLLASTLSAALAALADAHDGAAAAHVVLLSEDEPALRRTLLQAPAAATRDVNAWYAKVAAFGVGILLLVAAIGTIVCLCSMPTGTDTLLYARTKAD
jgi:hypothetical protein